MRNRSWFSTVVLQCTFTVILQFSSASATAWSTSGDHCHCCSQPLSSPVLALQPFSVQRCILSCSGATAGLLVKLSRGEMLVPSSNSHYGILWYKLAGLLFGFFWMMSAPLSLLHQPCSPSCSFPDSPHRTKREVYSPFLYAKWKI